MNCHGTGTGAIASKCLVLLALCVSNAFCASQALSCTLYVKGKVPAPGIAHASISCFGNASTSAVKIISNDRLLGSFKHKFKGVVGSQDYETCDTGDGLDCLVIVCPDQSFLPLGQQQNSMLTFTKLHITNVYVQLKALVCVGGDSIVDVQDAVLSGNTATPIMVMHNAEVSLNGKVNISGNNIGMRVGGAMHASGASKVVIKEAWIGSNVAWDGGGIFSTGQAVLQVQKLTCQGNKALQKGGCLAAFGQSNITVRTSIIDENSAVFGGGIALGESASLQLDSTTISSNAAASLGGGLFISDDTKPSDHMSKFDASTAFGSIITIGSATVIRNNTAAVGGACYANPAATRVRGPPKLVVSAQGNFAGNTAKFAAGIFAGPYITLEMLQASEVQRGSAPGNTDALKNTNGSTAAVPVFWAKVDCKEGEVLTGGYCQSCPPSTYSLNKNMQCQPCPSLYANCSGGNNITPLQGFWHSHMFSNEIHRCPIDASCGYGGTCADGYFGHLCAACRPGFVASGIFKCSKCMSEGVIIGLYAAATCALILIISYTIHTTWNDNQNVVQELKPSHILKILIMYIQYLVAVCSLPVRWPVTLSAVFKAADFLFAAASGQAVSLDCILENDILPVPVARQLLYLAVPVLVAFVEILLFALQPCKRGCCTAFSFQKTPVVLLVTLFFFFPAWVRVAFNFFACLPIDTKKSVNGNEYAMADAQWGYWIYFIQQPCWSGWHLNWAIIIGYPCLIVVCFGVPVGILFVLVKNSSRLNDPSFRHHFGFLTQNYKPSRCAWEAVVAVQTVVLVGLSVFRHTIGGYYSVLLISFVLLLSLAVHTWFRPFLFRKLHQLQVQATSCLLITTYIALSLFVVDRDNVNSYREIIGSFALLLNVSFICWCCYQIIMAAHGTIARSLESIQAWIRNAWLGSYLACVATTKARLFRLEASVEATTTTGSSPTHSGATQLQ